MPDTPSSSNSPRFDDWPVEDDSAAGIAYLGTTDSGNSFFVRNESNAIFEAELDDVRERIIPKPETERSIGSDQTLGEYIEEIGDELGWDRLSELAEEHLDRDS